MSVRIVRSIPQTITHSLLLPNGTAAAPSLAFSGNTNSGIYQSSPSVLDITLAGVRNFSFQQNPATVYLLSSAAQLVFGSPGDTFLARDAANTLALRSGTSLQTLVLGQGNAALAGGQLKQGKDASAVVAPGAGLGMLRWEAGTGANTLKLVAYSGTSTTGVTIVDNVGAGN